VEVLRVATSGLGRANLYARVFDYFTFYSSAAWALLWHTRRDDIVVAMTDPPMLSILAGPVAWLRRAQLVNWLQDVFPEVVQSLGYGRGRLVRAGLSFLRQLRNLFLKHARLNVVLGEHMAERVAAMGIPLSRIRIVPNWADGSLIQPIPREQNALRHDWGMEDAFVVGYSGNLGRAHDIDTLLNAISILDECHSPSIYHLAPIYDTTAAPSDAGQQPSPRQSLAARQQKIGWLFIGGGVRMEQFQREVERRHLSSVQFLPYQPREQLAESLSAADAHLISLQPALEGLIVPSKYYGIAAAGRPAIFIGNSDGEIARILKRSETGFVVEQGDCKALASAVLALANDPDLVREQGEKARRLFDTEYDLPHGLAAWEALLNEIAVA